MSTTVACIDAQVFLITVAVNAANAQINSVTGAAANAIVQSIILGASGGLCPNDLQFYVNTLIGQSNNLVSEIVANAATNVGNITSISCCG